MLRHHTSQSWKKHRARILNFITRYGEKKLLLPRFIACEHYPMSN